MITNLIVFILLNFYNINIQNQTLTVKLSGFESDKGKAFLQLLDKNEKEISTKIVEIKNKEAVAIFNNLPNEKYAVKAFHDANNNQKLDTNLLGIPKEKWGVSNNLKAKFGPPDFKKMLFEMNSNTSILIKLQ
jgi:uncharacterized protein (DUF2141 family)